ncbi:sorbosone dehydrogenase family protein [Ferruginibacter sp. HRS2-29]|uniref:PQQ-dependent sugar dehydrogenase n=1 Tax=Ferruginibacter sp. HRS2-29 TaxID=2487334 RepID=UPI0020CC3BF1|nr:sorbosone dehydrogenase family protein [Ferruginibacter sp. HRS2-29]MCP9749618.1 sorbosone dehydrogenase family protein [Ferruginibacter sp. HRS2-29]
MRTIFSQGRMATLMLAAILPLASLAQTSKDSITLPEPYATPSVQVFVKAIGWKGEQKPIAPPGFEVTKFASGLENPRWIYVAPNGDIFVAEAGTKRKKKKQEDEKDAFFKSKAQNFGSANRITLFRDKDKNGTYESKYSYISGLNQPIGMLVLNNYFYVANTDELLRFDYKPKDTAIISEGKKLLDLPGGGYNNHWTRNIISNPEKTKIYISVGSGSNVAEYGMDNEVRRANILEINPDGSGEKVYASGLRNPVGMDWAPGTKTLWTAVNERDELGDDLVPDYATSVQEGGFYGWPYSYFGQHVDPRQKGKGEDLVKRAIVPDVPLGSHTASLGLAFYRGKAFPEKYRNGMFIGQHGSWNRSVLSGYKVMFVPFANGKPSGPPENFLTGFIADEEKKEVFGRPVCVAELPDGSILVTDDAAKTIWQVKAM